MRSLHGSTVRCLVAALLFGLSTPLSKALLGSIGPFTLAGLLYLGAALGVLPLALRESPQALWRVGRQRLMLAGAVLFGGGLGPVFLLLGLQSAAAASVSLWLNLETVATTLLAWVFFRENLGRRVALAAAAILCGSVLLALPFEAGGIRAGLLIALACVCWGLDNNLTALVSGFTPSQTTLIKGVVAGTVNLALGLLIEPARAGSDAIGLALIVGVFSYGFSILLYISGAQELGATRSQLLFSTSPIVGMVVAWTLLQEPILTSQLLAAGVIGLGMYLMLTAAHDHEHRHERMHHVHSHRHDDGHHDHAHPGLPAGVQHTHPHSHQPVTHGHPHLPDLHHRHTH